MLVMIKRIIIGLQKNDKDKVALPANWEPGKDVILPPPTTDEKVDERLQEVNIQKSVEIQNGMHPGQLLQ